ncbi:MAG: POTRA domain-containing protein, partial [Limnobacter sp.]|nr:POTRA domain-containing protein [Limnobacter sp.]
MKLKERARKKKNSNSIACASLAILATLGNVLPQPAQAQSLPSIIDPGRIAVPEDNVKELSPYLGEREPAVVLEGAPEGASQIFFVLQDLQVRGVTVFSDEDIQFLYSGLLGQNISLAEVWRIAASLTQLYRREGFFLSKAFVPKQEIEG